MPLLHLMHLIGIEVSVVDRVTIPLRLINPSSDQFAHTNVKRLGCMTIFHSFMIPTSYVIIESSAFSCTVLPVVAGGVPSFWHLLRLYYTTISINALY